MAELRVGCGYDVHAFASDRQLVLGGVRFEHRLGLAGHSDADVLTHALIDALLGAAGWGDIGDWFDSADPQHRDAESLTFLERVAEELRRAGWRIINVDTTVVAQEPRLAARRAAIRERLAERLGVDPDRLSVKATSPDRLGAIGRADGIAAQAVVLLEAPAREAERASLAHERGAPAKRAGEGAVPS
jgi:2-C-methyl-D-erythritol 2,4-cyclodiphosphate synthase